MLGNPTSLQEKFFSELLEKLGITLLVVPDDKSKLAAWLVSTLFMLKHLLRIIPQNEVENISVSLELWSSEYMSINSVYFSEETTEDIVQQIFFIENAKLDTSGKKHMSDAADILLKIHV